ncbi:MAG TPA: helix-turn-helix transcriptional regulator [Chloroflexota bacterium]|nr:helix-turn-helix transcriptional regulator [Chloroflexota bacterium]
MADQPGRDAKRRHRRAFGERIRVLRLPTGLSQEALAAKAGLHRTYIDSVERGERNISLDNLYALAEVLEVDVRELFGPIIEPRC